MKKPIIISFALSVALFALACDESARESSGAAAWGPQAMDSNGGAVQSSGGSGSAGLLVVIHQFVYNFENNARLAETAACC